MWFARPRSISLESHIAPLTSAVSHYGAANVLEDMYFSSTAGGQGGTTTRLTSAWIHKTIGGQDLSSVGRPEELELGQSARGTTACGPTHVY